MVPHIFEIPYAVFIISKLYYYHAKELFTAAIRAETELSIISVWIPAPQYVLPSELSMPTYATALDLVVVSRACS